MRIFIPILTIFFLFTSGVYAQTTLFFQGFESSCNDTWTFSGGNTNNQTARTGNNSARVGRSGESNTLTFNTLNVTGYSGLVLQIHHSVRGGSGPGMDTREGAAIQVNLNGSGWSTIGNIGGFSDHSYAWNTSPGGSASASSGCTVYQCNNPLNYNVPAGTTSIALRVVSVTGGSCSTYNTNMTNGNASNFDRTDEGFFIDDIKLTTTGTVTNVNWTGQVSTDWFCAANWSPAIVPTSAINATFSTSNAQSQNHIVLVTGPAAECNNLSITGGASSNYSLKGENGATKILRVYGNLTLNGTDGLDFSDGTTGTPDGTIELKGNWDNQIGESHFKQGESTMILNGTTTQSITVTGSGPEIFYNFQVNKTSGSVTLNDNVEVCGNSTDPLADRAGVFTLTSGNVITGGNYVYAVNPATGGVAGGSASSFVDGNFRRQTNTSGLYDFPAGDGTRYMRAGVRPSTSAVNVIEVDAQNTGYGIYTPLEVSLVAVSQLRWWDISRISGSSPVAVRLYWLGTPASEGITNTGDLVVAHYSDRDHSGISSSTQWWNRGQNPSNSSGLINDGYVESSENVSTFSPFTLATLTSLNPLPVELTAFDATCTHSSVLFKWSTASEANNDHFGIDGSKDGIHFEELGTIQGAGHSNIPIDYEYSLTNVQRNVYFRLSQFDYNGTRNPYSTLYLPCENQHEFSVLFFDHSLQVVWPQNDVEIQWSITDINGKLLQNGVSKGTCSIQWVGASAGVYILHGINMLTGEVYSRKFMKF